MVSSREQEQHATLLLNDGQEVQRLKIKVPQEYEGVDFRHTSSTHRIMKPQEARFNVCFGRQQPLFYLDTTSNNRQIKSKVKKICDSRCKTNLCVRVCVRRLCIKTQFSVKRNIFIRLLYFCCYFT